MNATDDRGTDGISIQPCVNGFIVTGRITWQHSGPSNPPAEWYAFETYDALERHLREKLVGAPSA